MSFDVPAVLDELASAMEAARDPERASKQRAYMRDRFPFYGIPNPALTALSREPLAATPDQQEMVAFAQACFQRPEREWQYLACSLLRRHVKRCGSDLLPDVHHLITTKSWWDTVDTLASHTVGGLVAHHPQLAEDMDEWVTSGDIWVARTALLHQLGFKASTDADRLFAYCRQRAGDTEFFIRKAIGWALRTYSRIDGPGVRRFVDATPALSGLSRREALKWLDRNGG